MRVRSLVALVLLNVVATPALAGFAGTDLFIPMAGRGAGAYPSNWFTTVYLYNPNPTAVTVDLSFLERNKDNVATAPPKVTDTLAAGETRVYENIVEATFGKTAYGAIRIQCASKVVASTRVYSKESESAPLTQSFGQDFAATPASFAIGLNESTDILGGYSTLPYQDSAARFNIGCVETTGLGSATVRWVARDGAGQQQDSYDRVVPRLSQTQGFFHQYFDGVDLTNSRVSASVVAGNGKVICYGSLVTNDKEQPKPVQDPTTFEMVYPEKALGIAGVQHDPTLTGDGTAGAPLGLADGAVSQGKLAAQGATAGQVLGTNGTELQWQNGGLGLPYSGSSGSAGNVFQVTSTGSAPAIVGIKGGSTGELGTVSGVRGRQTGAGYGVLGENYGDGFGVFGQSDGGIGVAGTAGTRPGVQGSSAFSYGVYGYSTHNEGIRGETSGDGVGVHGKSTTGDGVFGESSATNKSGVFAVNDNPAGWAGFFRGRVGITGAVECTGCVGTSDLSASGGTNGQVLGISGSTPGWQNDGLSLPYASDASSDDFLFSVLNHSASWANSAIKGDSVNGMGLRGWSHNNVGVYAESKEGGAAVEGHAYVHTGVVGRSGQDTFYSAGDAGVLGLSGGNPGVKGLSNSGEGVLGVSSSGGGVRGVSQQVDGVRGESSGADKSGVYGVNSNGAGYGVFGRNSGTGATGLLGGAAGASGAIGGNTGWLGYQALGYQAAGVYGLSVDSNGNGVYGEASNGGNAWGVWGKSTSGYAGYFSGNVHVVGNLSATGTKPFRIDHPLDPGNRVLYHFAVESPDVSNVYHGNIVLDATGEAVVELPEYFEALNRDVRYQLTCIGGFAPVYVAAEVAGNRFRIAGGTGGLKVSWQVTAIRNDPSARLRVPAVVQDKAPEERGFYLDPEAWGQPETLSMEWAHHPEAMKAMQEARETALAAGR
jgi:hypothetical protein